MEVKVGDQVLYGKYAGAGDPGRRRGLPDHEAERYFGDYLTITGRHDLEIFYIPSENPFEMGDSGDKLMNEYKI